MSQDRRRLRLGKDPLGPRIVEADGPPAADQPAVGQDLIDDGASAVAGGVIDGAPLDGQAVALTKASTDLDGAGHDPFDVEAIIAVGGLDDQRTRVLAADGIDAVDGVDPGQTVVGVPADGQIAGEGTGVEHGQKGHDADGPSKPFHDADASSGQTGSVMGDPGPLESTGSDVGEATETIGQADEVLVIPRWLKLAAAGFLTVIAAAMAFAIFEPIQVLPRIRVAPGYALTAEDGTMLTSESARGSVTLYSFAPTECPKRCAEVFETMRIVQARVDDEIDLGETDFRLVTIALDAVPGPEQLASAASESGADGEIWRWVGGDKAQIRNVIGAGFQRFYQLHDDGTIDFDPGFVLVDGNGVIRGEYRYQTLADDADKFVRHIQILAEEIRYAQGPTAVAYEAAHLFLCYP